MVSRIIKCIEDLTHINQHRITRNSSNETGLFCKFTEETFAEQLQEDVPEGEDPKLLAALVEALTEANVGMDDWQQSRKVARRHQSYDNSAIVAAETLDAVFEKLGESLQPIKAAHVAKDPNAWSASFGSTPPDARSEGTRSILVQTMGGKVLHLPLVSDPSQTLAELRSEIFKYGGPRPADQKLIIGDAVAEENDKTLESLGLDDGTTITLVCESVCETCLQKCKCADCHGEGRYAEGCQTCGEVRPDCKKCKGPCRCTKCHGSRRTSCNLCGQRPPCWGGDVLVLLGDGSAKKVRDCTVGDEVRTLRGSRRISRIWGRDPTQSQNVDTEVCCIDGVWITSHHPVIHGQQWVFPADIKASALWSKRQHIVPDMFNFELEGHDDTILLWGGGDGGVVVSCTLGKYLGPRFGNGVWTRRSTRCQHDCAQCDAVFVEGFSHSRIPSELRWARFADFPQVEWDDGVSEFALAAAATESFIPPPLPGTCSQVASRAEPVVACMLCAPCS